MTASRLLLNPTA